MNEQAKNESSVPYSFIDRYNACIKQCRIKALEDYGDGGDVERSVTTPQRFGLCRGDSNNFISTRPTCLIEFKACVQRCLFDYQQMVAKLPEQKRQ